MNAASRTTLKQVLKVALFAGSSLLVVGVFLFTHLMIDRLSHEFETTSRVLARFCAQASFPATRDPQLMELFSDLMGGLDFPIVITDARGIPRAWRQLDVDPALVPATSLDSLEQRLPISPVIRARIDRVRTRVAELDRTHEPIAMTLARTRISVGAVHYGEPPVLARLRWMPFVSGAGVALLIVLGLSGLAVIRQAERRFIWIGMAKETAHQLGTPLSSLMGWTELMRARIESSAGGEVRIPAAEYAETVSEIERDLERLNKVAQRFSQVGSAPRLETGDVSRVVREVVAYMRRRLPRGAGEVAIQERYEAVPPARINAGLIEWALENLISNAVTAMDQRPGLIEVWVRPKGSDRIEITVKDNGRGMSPKEQRQAFEPGYTTRLRGWGLGLPLARRVVEEYHRGRLTIAASAPGEGTTMVVSLPL